MSFPPPLIFIEQCACVKKIVNLLSAVCFELQNSCVLTFTYSEFKSSVVNFILICNFSLFAAFYVIMLLTFKISCFVVKGEKKTTANTEVGIQHENLCTCVIYFTHFEKLGDIIRIHPLGNLDICTNFYCNPSSSC